MKKNNTKKSFTEKWTKNPDLVFKETMREGSDILNWILTRNGFKSTNHLKKYLKNKKRILDAGCGNGRVTALLRENSNSNTTEIVGIDLVAYKIAKKNLANYKNLKVYKQNLLTNMKGLGSFDFIYCQEVLHHTGNPQKGFLNLSKLLTDKGEIAIYVYKKKAPIREFVDDYVRTKISSMSYDKAYKSCAQITELGKALSELKFQIDIPQVDVLEIEKGKYNIQRFIYHFFMKCFWNSEISFKDNTVINYDWYHPQDCTRHTLTEVRKWFKAANLKITREYSDHYGITMMGSKR